MKKQKKQLIVCVILLILCILGYLGLLRYNANEEAKAEAEADTEEVIFTMDTSEIVAFSYTTAEYSYHYTYDGANWTCDEEPDIDLDEDSITSLLSNVASISCTYTVEDAEALSEYGLEEPFNVIVLTTEDAEYTLTVGDYNSTSDCYYYMTSLSDDVYAGTAAICEDFISTPDVYEAEVEEEADDEETEE